MIDLFCDYFSNEFARGLQQIAKKHGAYFFVDEVQTGLIDWENDSSCCCCYAGSIYGPVGPRPRAPRLGGPRTWKMLPNKRKKEKVGREKKGKKGKKRKREEKKGKKRKGRWKKLFLGQTNWQKDSHVSQWRGFEGPWGPRTPDWAQGPAGAWSGLG